MCTVSWWRGDAGAFTVFFNRDERRTRPVSEPVRTAMADDGTPFLAPRDSAAGGTWLLANTHGLVVGMLNHYSAAAVTRPVDPTRSRGLLPLQLAPCRSLREVAGFVPRLDLRAYAPFILVVWDGGGQASWTWNGWQVAEEVNLRPPLTTSSHRPHEVCAWRRARFDALAGDGTPEKLAAYHDDAAHADSAFNVRMRRGDARTESVCRVEVSATRVRFMHRREAPDRLDLLDQHEATLGRR